MPKIACKLFCIMPIHQLIQSSYIMYKILRAYLCPFNLDKTYTRYSMPISCVKDFNQGRKKFDGSNKYVFVKYVMHNCHIYFGNNVFMVLHDLGTMHRSRNRFRHRSTWRLITAPFGWVSYSRYVENFFIGNILKSIISIWLVIILILKPCTE